MNTATHTDASTLTFEKFQNLLGKFKEDRKQYEVTLGGHTFNVLDYDERFVKYPEGGRLLTSKVRTGIQQVMDPKPTDMILLDVKAGQVFFLGGDSKVIVK